MAGGVVKHGREAGFTLIEVILVLILIGVVSSVISSYINDFQLEDESLARERLMMIARITHARNEALALNKERDFEITQEGKAIQYSNLTLLPGEEHTNGSTKEVTNAIVSLKDVQVTTADGKSTLSFYTDGTYEGPSSLTITSTKDANQSVTLTISGVGYVQ